MLAASGMCAQTVLHKSPSVSECNGDTYHKENNTVTLNVVLANQHYIPQHSSNWQVHTTSNYVACYLYICVKWQSPAVLHHDRSHAYFTDKH
eukprot:2323-Heterococcus_DN1.PRE.3